MKEINSQNSSVMNAASPLPRNTTISLLKTILKIPCKVCGNCSKDIYQMEKHLFKIRCDGESLWYLTHDTFTYQHPSSCTVMDSQEHKPPSPSSSHSGTMVSSLEKQATSICHPSKLHNAEASFWEDTAKRNSFSSQTHPPLIRQRLYSRHYRLRKLGLKCPCSSMFIG